MRHRDGVRVEEAVGAVRDTSRKIQLERRRQLCFCLTLRPGARTRHSVDHGFVHLVECVRLLVDWTLPLLHPHVEISIASRSSRLVCGTLSVPLSLSRPLSWLSFLAADDLILVS